MDGRKKVRHNDYFLHYRKFYPLKFFQDFIFTAENLITTQSYSPARLGKGKYLGRHLPPMSMTQPNPPREPLSLPPLSAASFCSCSPTFTFAQWRSKYINLYTTPLPIQ